MNTELAEAALSAHDRRLVVLDDSEDHPPGTWDMVEIDVVLRPPFRRRSARNRALKAIGCAQRDIEPQAVIPISRAAVGGAAPGGGAGV